MQRTQRRRPAQRLSGYHLHIGPSARKDGRKVVPVGVAVPIECIYFIRTLQAEGERKEFEHDQYLELSFLTSDDARRTSKLLAEYLRHELNEQSRPGDVLDEVTRDGPRYETMTRTGDPYVLVTGLHPREKWYIDFVQKLSLMQLQSVWKAANVLQIPGLQTLCERQAAQMMVTRAQQQAAFVSL